MKSKLAQNCETWVGFELVAQPDLGSQVLRLQLCPKAELNEYIKEVFGEGEGMKLL